MTEKTNKPAIMYSKEKLNKNGRIGSEKRKPIVISLLFCVRKPRRRRKIIFGASTLGGRTKE